MDVVNENKYKTLYQKTKKHAKTQKKAVKKERDKNTK